MAEIVINSFESGEISPVVYGRTDLEQYQRAAASLKNMVVLPNGSARKRPGTEWISNISSTGRLIQFQTDALDSDIVEITNGKLRVLDIDGTELNSFTDSDFTTLSLPTIKHVQSKFDMILTSKYFRPKRLTKGSSAYSLEDLPVDPPSGTPGYPTFGTTAGKRPKSTAFIDQRLIFAGTELEPNGIFGSGVQALEDYIQSATASVDMDANSTASGDEDPFHYSVLDYGYIDIGWAVSTNTLSGGVLMIGTEAGLYAVSGVNGLISAAPGGITAIRQSVAGCSTVQGTVVNNYIVFIDSSRRNVRIAQFNLQSDQYETARVNELSEHLFHSDVKEIHYQRSPHSMLWAVLEDGSVRVFGYDGTGALAAWTPIDLGVEVKSMTVARGTKEDTPVFLTYDSAAEQHSLIKMKPFDEEDQDEYWFLDYGVRKTSGTAFTTVDGLTHLNGKEVQIWADGAAHPPRTVDSGEIELNREVKTAIVGIGYTAEVETLPVFQAQDKVKRVNKLFVRFKDTLDAKAGDEEFEEIVPFREGGFTMGEAPAPFNGIKKISYSGRYDLDAQVRFFSDAPAPFHVLSVITRLEVYG